MSSRAWIVSDTHFGHRRLADGILRPWTDSEFMNAEMVTWWNELVRPEDRVYHLGDIAMNRRYVSVLGQCHGRKVLVKGNHDLFKLADYLPYVEDIRAYHVIAGNVLLSHMPVHESQQYRYRRNIHGHTHELDIPDPWYTNVCVERTNYRPILLDEALAR